MVFNAVADTQKTYRKLLDSMSRPGKIVVLEEVDDHFVPCHEATFLTAMTLLDAEVSFHVVADQGLAKPIAEMTFAKLETAEKADYIFVPENAEEKEILDAMKRCRVGTLGDPQDSATWIIEQKKMSNENELVLSGPGIKERASFQTELSHSFWEGRNDRVKEFPLGIDLIFTDRGRRLASIPRTTNVEKKGGNPG